MNQGVGSSSNSPASLSNAEGDKGTSVPNVVSLGGVAGDGDEEAEESGSIESADLWEVVSTQEVGKAIVRRVRLLENSSVYTHSWAEDSDQESWEEQLDTWATTMNRYINAGRKVFVEE